MAQWMQCDFIQQTPTWADSVCSLAPGVIGGGGDERRQARALNLRDRQRHDAEEVDRIINALKPYINTDIGAGVTIKME